MPQDTRSYFPHERLVEGVERLAGRTHRTRVLRSRRRDDIRPRAYLARESVLRGALAGETFERFAAHNKRLLDGAKLRVYPSKSDPTQLALDEGSDGVCYLVRNEWHPHRSVDSSIEDLLADSRVSVIEEQKFPGMSVYKVKITR